MTAGRGGRVWGVFVLGAVMSDMNVRPPKEAERSLALLGMTAEGEGGKRERLGRVCFVFVSQP